VEGAVGSGKTVVAAAALWLCVGGGFQGALMAPTEILAGQHYLTFRRLLTPLGVRVGLVIGGAARRERERMRDLLRAGEVEVAIGTHALLDEGVAFARLGLVVVDEQHKFGVTQRAALRHKGFHPDVLVMTATPIPRTLSLTLYGDLDVSVLDEMPPGRGMVRTYVRGPGKRPEVYAWVREQANGGRQATIMVIEDADRFGLAQHHQLRGRIGRGAQTSHCVLLSSLATDAARTRMETMAQTQDGFVIAQRDLQLRGPGEILGTRQHGLPDLRVADLITDVAVLELARDEAHRLLLEDPDLSQREHAALA